MSRSVWKFCIRYMKPMVRFAEQVARGTRTSSRKSSAVSEDLLPIFSSFLETEKPLSELGTRKNEQPWAPLSGCVLTSIVTKSARVPLVMNVFWPLMM